MKDFVIFQLDNLLVDTSFFVNITADAATPAATPAVPESFLAAPASATPAA